MELPEEESLPLAIPLPLAPLCGEWQAVQPRP